METLSDTLTQRVEDLIESHHHEKLLHNDRDADSRMRAP